MMSDQDMRFIEFMTGGVTPFETHDMDYMFRMFLKCTFGEDFYQGIIKEGSDLFMLTPTQPAIAFQDQGFDFVLSQIALPAAPLTNTNWQLTIKHDGKDFITNIVEVPAIAQPGDMVLTFHGLKAEMIVELQQYIAQTKGRTFEEQLREQRNVEIALPEPDLLLANTSIRLADWECQLIIAAIQSGATPKQAIAKAKQLIYIQTTKTGWEPGDLSLFDECKPSDKDLNTKE